MARQHDDSCECLKTELDIFSIPPTQTSMQHGFWNTSYPAPGLTDKGPIEFNFVGDGDYYLDISNTYLYLKVCITKADGTNLGVGDHAGPINNWMHSLFEEVIVQMGDVIISYPSNCYPYRAYFETLLSVGKECKESQLSMVLWNKDTAGHMDDRTCATTGEHAGTNMGLRKRGKFTAVSEEVELVGRLHTDLTSQDRFLPNNLPIKIKLMRSKDIFSLMSPAGLAVKVNVKEAVLYYRQVELNKSVQVGLDNALQMGTAKYPITRVQCKYFSNPVGMTTINHENLFRGQMPTRVIVGLVNSTAFNGSLAENPFNFQHFNLSAISLHIGGMPTPIKPMRPTYPHQNLQSYMSVFTGTGKWKKDEGCGFTRSEHANGYCLYAWDLTADLSQGNNFELLKNTTMRLELTFATPLPTTVNAIIYAEFQNMLMVDNARQVTNNFSV